MALDLWDTGVDVRLILPGAIDTEIWDLPGNDRPVLDGPLEPPETWPQGSSTPSRATASSTTCPT